MTLKLILYIIIETILKLMILCTVESNNISFNINYP